METSWSVAARSRAAQVERNDIAPRPVAVVLLPIVVIDPTPRAQGTPPSSGFWLACG